MAGTMRRDALGREIVLSMVHDDGHVGSLANRGTLEATVTQLHTLYSWLGVKGWAVQYLPVDDATHAFMRGQGCRRCTVVFGCGCSWQRVAARQCQHDTPARLHALAHVVGYCTNDNPMHQGPPLPDITRVYQPGARMGHLALRLAGANAQCGAEPPEDGWLGWAGEKQQAVAARLPVCNMCLREVGSNA